jgi:thiamine-phosphate pyrophosphorylase
LLLYYITDRTQFPGDEAQRRRRLLEKIAEAARCAVDLIQLREKDLPARELEALARAAVESIRQNSQLRTENREPRTGLLINSRTDIALAVGADGVHLRSEDVSVRDVRTVWGKGGRARSAKAIVGISCHTPEEVHRAASDGADFVVFGPVFGKKGTLEDRPAGLERLRRACQEKIPVLALGGITLENAQACLATGAAGIAGIRLFQENEIRQVVETLRR